MPAPEGIRNVLETCLYVADMAGARNFYEDIMGLTPQFADERMTGYRLGDTMLLLFLEGATGKPVDTGTGIIPPHSAEGPVHFALSVMPDALSGWREHLENSGVTVESAVRWPKWRANSLYFRDPDNHLVELATVGLWGIE